MLADAHAAFMGCKVAQYLSEELGEGSATGRREPSTAKADAEASAVRRRTLLATMTQHGSSLLALLIQAASHYLQQATAAAAQGQDAAASNAAVGAALEATGAAVVWLPLRVLRSSALADACASLLQTHAFRGHAVEILLQAAGRASKQASKDAEEYLSFYASVAQLLCAAAPKVVPESMSADTLETDDDAATAADRLVEALSSFVMNGHLGKLKSSEIQLQFLWQLARLLGVGYTPLAVRTLPAWRRLMQVQERTSQRANGARAMFSALLHTSDCGQYSRALHVRCTACDHACHSRRCQHVDGLVFVLSCISTCVLA